TRGESRRQATQRSADSVLIARTPRSASSAPDRDAPTSPAGLRAAAGYHIPTAESRYFMIPESLDRFLPSVARPPVIVHSWRRSAGVRGRVPLRRLRTLGLSPGEFRAFRARLSDQIAA